MSYLQGETHTARLSIAMVVRLNTLLKWLCANPGMSQQSINFRLASSKAFK